MPDSNLLYPHLKQLEVDFVIPLLRNDLPLCIDPFLLYKSRDPAFRLLHEQLISHFRAGMTALAYGKETLAEYILTFPEVAAVGFGYGTSNKRGSGLGKVLRKLLIDTLRASPAILNRQIRHVEEMQLISPGIGPDRVGDIASNIIKDFLITYTQRQCLIHNIPLHGNLPVEHVYDEKEREWRDGYYDFPINPHDGGPVLLVPRRIVRNLPWINYDNFVRTEFRLYLAAKRGKAGRIDVLPSKTEVTTTSRVETAIIDNYVKQREEQAAEAQPFIPSTSNEVIATGDSLKKRLTTTPVGHASASAYQQLVLDIFNFALCPDLMTVKWK